MPKRHFLLWRKRTALVQTVPVKATHFRMCVWEQAWWAFGVWRICHWRGNEYGLLDYAKTGSWFPSHGRNSKWLASVWSWQPLSEDLNFSQWAKKLKANPTMKYHQKQQLPGKEMRGGGGRGGVMSQGPRTSLLHCHHLGGAQPQGLCWCSVTAVWTLLLRPPVSLARAPWCPPARMAPCLVGRKAPATWSCHLNPDLIESGRECSPCCANWLLQWLRTQLSPMAQKQLCVPRRHIHPPATWWKKHKIRTLHFQKLPEKLMHSICVVMASNRTTVFKAWSKGILTVWPRPGALRIGEPEYSLRDCICLSGLLWGAWSGKRHVMPSA